MISIGVIGQGQFGRFAAEHLARHARVTAFDTVRKEGDFFAPLEEVCKSDIVIFAVPVQNLAEACAQAAPHLSAQTLVADVSSVKVRSLEILKRHLPEHELLGTHPIFGPQSGKHGIRGLPIVLSNDSWTPEHYQELKGFLSDTLGLRVIERTPEEHDREMAQVQGLTHLIGRALARLRIHAYETSTMSHQRLIELMELLKDDSWELFKTIENENPYASGVRHEFRETLKDLERELEA